MASGFSGGGPDFYSGLAGRSMSTTMNTAANNNPAPPTYRNQLSQMLVDPSTQIVQHRMGNSSFAPPGLIGKRTLAEFQAQQQQHQHGSLNPALNGLLLRSVKPRMYQQNSPISTLSPFEFSASASSEFPNISQHYGVPLLQQVRPQPTNLGSGLPIHSQNLTLPGISYKNAVNYQTRVGGTVVMGQDSEKKMKNQLEELEKQLLDDNDEEGDAVSAITNANSEWSETIQSLISVSSPNPMAPSPSSSSSSTTSVTNPVPNCSKQTLVEAASAISEGKFDVATEILKCMAKVSNPEESSEQRLMGYMLTALKSRVNPTENPPPVTELYSKEHFGSTQLLYEVSPCFKLGLMAANFAILEASVEQPKSEDGFHVIDFDIGQGTQYMDLLYLLSERWKGKPPMTLKITALADIGGEEKERLKLVGDKLSQLADRLGVALRFYVVCCRLSDLSRESLGCEPDEPLAVNFAFKLYRMPDESVSIENPRDELLRRVKKLSPRVVTIVEQEMNTNTAPFTARVNETLSYYSALLESIESTLQKDTGERVKVEQGLGRRLGNSVACEGRDRLERCEVFGKWRARMGMAGFELKQMGQEVGESVKERLGCSGRVNSGFNVKHVNGGVCFGWMGKTLTVASAWR
ncbi:hypothetical protein K2173_008584 [Erythroxylum novogranatense]|uniref:Scarecrow-like protein 8 n=1 Tax=Erythroxylum novogranatense TaxID=1862640 RepID=A0AAV8SLI2_9ROSI|nr:hypothetical protein K2173_008584 [Erythroxylum novogranatense]